MPLPTLASQGGNTIDYIIAYILFKEQIDPKNSKKSWINVEKSTSYKRIKIRFLLDPFTMVMLVGAQLKEVGV